MSSRTNHDWDVVHVHLANGGNSEAGSDNVGKPGLEVAARSLNKGLFSWKRWNGDEFKPIYDGSEKSVCLLYGRPPPKIVFNDVHYEQKIRPGKSNVGLSGTKKKLKRKENGDEAVLWCRWRAQRTVSVSFHGKDFCRYKTEVDLKDSLAAVEDKQLWKLMCKALQKGQLVYCNACYEVKERLITIYHYGAMKPTVIAWISKNLGVSQPETYPII